MASWTNPAKERLKRLHNFIAADSPMYAKRVTQELVRKSEMLAEFPRMGRIVPELNDENIRELLVYSYRLIYGIVDADVIILAIVHSKQDMSGGLPL